jgi:hypothetical protein
MMHRDDEEERALDRMEHFVKKHTPTMREMAVLAHEARRRGIMAAELSPHGDEQQYHEFARVVLLLEDYGRDVREAKEAMEELRAAAGFRPAEQELSAGFRPAEQEPADN